VLPHLHDQILPQLLEYQLQLCTFNLTKKIIIIIKHKKSPKSFKSTKFSKKKKHYPKVSSSHKSLVKPINCFIKSYTFKYNIMILENQIHEKKNCRVINKVLNCSLQPWFRPKHRDFYVSTITTKATSVHLLVILHHHIKNCNTITTVVAVPFFYKKKRNCSCDCNRNLKLWWIIKT
jgi:hypothetical protein